MDERDSGDISLGGPADAEPGAGIDPNIPKEWRKANVIFARALEPGDNLSAIAERWIAAGYIVDKKSLTVEGQQLDYVVVSDPNVPDDEIAGPQFEMETPAVKALIDHLDRESRRGRTGIARGEEDSLVYSDVFIEAAEEMPDDAAQAIRLASTRMEYAAKISQEHQMTKGSEAEPNG